MRSYTSSNGEKIEVTKEHLDTAVRIKRELQMSSPSHKCSWSLHKKMMEKEGFYDSDTNESYRCMIKSYQKSIGELDDIEEYTNKVADSKLKSIKEAVGELTYTKREVQIESRKLNKLKRELTLFGVIAEQVREALLQELNLEIPKWVVATKHKELKNKMIIILSDWHIGAVVVNVCGNSFNYSIAKKRVEKYFKEILKLANLFKISDVYVVCTGDVTEHAYMRYSQGIDVEFPFGEQIVKAFELIRDFILNLTQYFNVIYTGISGNHDRLQGNKEINHDADSSMFIINYMIKEFIQIVNSPRLQYVEPDAILYSTVLEINGVKMKFVHGDKESGNNKLARHSLMDNVDYQILVMGHVHYFQVSEVGNNKFEMCVGSLKGVDNYAKKGKFVSSASQGIIIVGENKELDFKRVDLQHV
jgi:predicted phosphodiesterase